ncbi:S-layer homology domain-containing protein [Paenibacillus agaridevorans]|uniref:S-layer homology domain-containing protein n=1 Tax=Paenibacillus agaridevorans TaxID=171404 RepID=UPI001BE4322F|nr:S-layer homology domain-containing protein [Paenibacillus agaridevorans]
MKRLLSLFMSLSLIAALVVPPAPLQAAMIADAQQLVEFLRTKLDVGGDASKIKTADGNMTAQVSTPVTINETFNVPVGVKLQLFVKLGIQEEVTVDGKLQDSRALEFRRDGVVGTGIGSVLLNSGSSYYQQGIEVVGAAGVLQPGADSSVRLLANSELYVTSGTVTVAAGKTVTSDMFKRIEVAEGAKFEVKGVINNDVVVVTPVPTGSDQAVDKAALVQAISGAIANKDATAVSVDGTDVPSSGKWVTSSAADALITAIQSAIGVRDNAAATQSQVTEAEASLAAAVQVFDAAKQDGTRTGLPAEIKTAQDLTDWLRNVTVNDTLVKLSGNTVELYESIAITEPLSIPAGVKLQSFANMTVNAAVTVSGTVQDSRTPDKRGAGLAGNGSGAVVFRTGSSYYQQGTEVVGPNGIFKLGADSSVEMRGNHHLRIASGIVTLAKPVMTSVVQRITVASEAIFNASASNIGAGVDYTPVSAILVRLNELIQLAEANISSTPVSVNGAGLTSDQYWVTAAHQDVFAQNIEDAVMTKNNSSATESDYQTAAAALEAAAQAFNDAKQPGAVLAEEIATADELLEAMNGLNGGAESVARRLADERVGEKTFHVVEVFKPVTVTKKLTVPSNVRLKFTAQMTVHAVIQVKGQLQDFRDEGFIIGNGIVGASGIGSAVFEPGSAMYIKGKGETIGDTGMLRVEPNSKLSMYAKNRMEITTGKATVLKPLITSLTTELSVQSGAELTVIGSIPKEIAVQSSGTYIDASTTNTESKLGMVGDSAESSDEAALAADIQDGRIYLTVKSMEQKKVTVTVKATDGRTATIEADLKNGGIVSKSILKYGALSAAELKARIQSKISELEALILKAQARQLDTEREKGAVWFAKEYDKYADWDEKNIDVNKKMFGVIPSYSPGGRSPEELALELPEFQRTEVIALLDTSIAELTAVLDGTVVRRPVRLVDWDGIELQGSNFYSEGKPVFLHDYFSKPLDVSKDNATLYNDYLGKIDVPKSINPSFVSDENGTPTADKYGDLQNRPSNNMGYTILWHDPSPAWATSKHGETLRDGITTFTKYDINHPEIRSIWSNVLKQTGPITSGKPYTELGYLLANEPHWFLEKGHWATPKKVNGQEGISDIALQQFASWLQERHQTISDLNALWGTSYASFDVASRSVIPLDKKYKGTPIGYDVSLFNMERGTEWLRFLHEQVKKNDPEANTHIKIMPDLFVEDNRTHGIDFEKLTEMVDIIGDDAKTRKENFKSTGQAEDWKEHYSYMWKELAMSYDFMSSVSPEKAHINSEVHFLSTVAYRDLYMKPEYVRNTYWLATLLGMDAGFTWFWGRNPDGSIENRLMTTSVQGLLESYPGTVAQQPRVANELSKTMMDLNAFSEEIVKFQEQRKPVRIFYSETAAINDTHYMEDQFELYEALYFSGVPVGFVTASILEKQPHSNWDAVVIRKTEEVTDAEFAALQSYLNQGGTVITDAGSLKATEYKKPRTAALTQGSGVLLKPVDESAVNMAEQAFGVLEQKDSLSPVNLMETNGSSQRGAMWRVVPYGDDRYMMTIVNLGKHEASLKAAMADNQSFTVRDMMTGQSLGTSWTLKPEGVMLLELQAVPAGGGSPAPDNSGPVKQPSAPVKVTADTIKNGVARSKLSGSLLQSAVEQAVNGTVRIQVEVPAAVNEIQLQLPASSVSAAGKAQIKKLTIDTGLAVVSIPLSMLQKDLGSNAQNVEITVKKTSVKLDSEKTRAVVKDNPVYDFTLSVDGTAISHFGNRHTVELQLPYTLKAGAKPKYIVAYYINDKSELEVVKNSRYDEKSGMLIFHVKHFSYYTVAAASVSFKDLATVPWAEESILSLAARDIVQGTGAGAFQPVKQVSRAQFVQMLVNAFELGSGEPAVSTFKDVEQEAWYSGALGTAQALGIISGKPDGNFGVHDSITRQEMAVMVHRLLEAERISLPAGTGSLQAFKDEQLISGYAAASVKALQTSGLLEGSSNGRFGPKDLTTRAQAAVLLERLLELQ